MGHGVKHCHGHWKEHSVYPRHTGSKTGWSLASQYVTQSHLTWPISSLTPCSVQHDSLWTNSVDCCIILYRCVLAMSSKTDHLSFIYCLIYSILTLPLLLYEVHTLLSEINDKISRLNKFAHTDKRSFRYWQDSVSFAKTLMLVTLKKLFPADLKRHIHDRSFKLFTSDM